jgi:hypothetical protein
MPDEPNDTRATPPELPSPSALRRATLIASVVAAILFVVAVLPAEYNVDPTGLGRVLGLKEIGEIKQDAAAEAADAAIEGARPPNGASAAAAGRPARSGRPGAAPPRSR